MSKQLWVDYTNHRGERRWRQVTELLDIGMHFYPPREIGFPGKPGTEQPCITARLADRNSVRLLALASCHRFLWQAEAPLLEPTGAPRVATPTISHHPLDPAPGAAEDYLGRQADADLLSDVQRQMAVLVERMDATGQIVGRVARAEYERDAVYADSRRLMMENAAAKELVEKLRAQIVHVEERCKRIGTQRDEFKRENGVLRHERSEALELAAAAERQRDDAIHALKEVERQRDDARREASEAETLRLDVRELTDRLETIASTTSAAGRDGPWAMTNLSFGSLRTANKARQEKWDARNQLDGATALGRLYRANEMAGEAGEAANVVKKLVREQLGISGSRSTERSLADELADVVICADLLAADYMIDLAECVRTKFNKTSTERGFAVELRLRDGVWVDGVQV